MENASKALIIAGAILVALLIISLGILVFNKFRAPVIDNANMDKEEIAAFNSKITPYTGKNVSGSQVNALLQYCLSVNISARQSGENFKIINISGNSGASMTRDASGNYTGYTRVNTGKDYFYTVTATTSSRGLMTTINIQKQ